MKGDSGVTCVKGEKVSEDVRSLAGSKTARGSIYPMPPVKTGNDDGVLVCLWAMRT